mgnify:CR=1 FL=1
MTVQVAREIRTALEDGLALPTELSEVPWRLIPSAIGNMRDGRAYDDWPKTEKPKESADDIRKRMKQVHKAIKGLEDAEEQGESLRESVDGLLKLAKKMGHAVPRCDLAGESEREPVVRDEPAEPEERARPNRPPRGGRGGRGGGRR